MSKITPISGFPEWLPEQRIVEQRFLDLIRQQFELFGFAPLETRSVEPLDQLLKKGETDKEIYVLRRLHAEEGTGDSGLGLHFDLTVPFARYVAQYRGHLHFPLKRYQVQKVWRGERPQEGRYREFYQADIDVVAQDVLPLCFDAEMPALLHAVLSFLPMPPVTILVNNRKIMEGFYRGLGIEDVHSVLRVVDKLEKIGREGVAKLLVDEQKLAHGVAEQCLALARIQSSDASFAEQVRALGVQDDLMNEGLDELSFVMESTASLGSVVADLRIARGFDYYTGTVYETVMQGHEDLGSVCSGGRYDNLVSGGSARFPGVGISIGVTRILGRLFSQDLVRASRRSPTCVLVALVSEDERASSAEIVDALRKRGIASEVFHLPQKYGKQIRYAERKQIPFVWFPAAEGSGKHEVRDIRSGEQEEADPESWLPPDSDREIQIITEPDNR